MKKEASTEGMSLSKQRKVQKQAEIEKKKKEALKTKLIWGAVIVAVVVILGLGIASDIRKKNSKVTATSDYSALLNDDGTIEGVDAEKYVTIPDYKNITVSQSELTYSEESVESDINSLLSEHAYVDTSVEHVATLGEKVNIDFEGKIDGVAFSGGTGTNYDIELGTQTFIDDFEEQIAGHVPGETFDVEVTFPDSYSNTELAGKDAVFTVTLNGVYTNPEFTDSFVATYLSEYASTTEEYRQYIRDKKYEENFALYIENYLINNTELKSYPKAYLKQIKSNYKGDEYAYYEYLDNMYNNYYGYTRYGSFENFLSSNYSMTEDEYDASLTDKVSSSVVYALAVQAIAKREGITASIDEVKQSYLENGYTEENFNSQLSTYGTGYLVQRKLLDKVIRYIMENVTVN